MNGALETFLNSAIVIDDAIGIETVILDKASAKEQLRAIWGAPSSDLGVAQSGESEDAGVNDGESAGVANEGGSSVVDFSAIADGFLSKGIVCGLFNPKKDGRDIDFDGLIRICQQADLIVLDWKMGDSGNSSAAALKKIVEDGSIGTTSAIHQIAIYSNASADDIVSDMTDTFPEAERKGDWFSINGMRGLLLKKGDVSEKDLCSHIVKKLERQYDGVLPDFAFRGVAAIRRNVKKIIGRFKPSLDYELALHSILTRKEDDIKEQLVELLTEEIKSVLEDDASIGTSSTVYAELGLQLALYEPRDDKAFWHLLPFVQTGNGVAFDREQAFSSLAHYLANDFDDKEKDAVRVFKDRAAFEEIPNREALPAMLSALSEISGLSENEIGGFAELMSLRAMYTKRKVLRCGTLVKVIEKGTGDKSKNFNCVCIVPTCDGRRLKSFAEDNDGNVPFLFWRLADKPAGVSSAGIGLVLRKATNGTQEGYEKKYVQGKFRNYAMIIQIPCDNEEVAFDEKGYIQFDRYEIKWLGQLKDFHAQRIMHYVGTSLSKVGLLEEEILRRSALIK